MALRVQFGGLLLMMLMFCFIILSPGQEPFLPNSMVLEVAKDVSTLQYVTEVQMGEPLASVKLGIDLSGEFLWVDCSSVIRSSSRNSIGCCSMQCTMVKSDCCSRPSGADHGKICAFELENPVTKMVSRGDLEEGSVAVEVTDGLKTGSFATIPDFLFSCADKSLLKGLAGDVKGMLGLGNFRIALPDQISSTFGFRRKFALCLSSSKGVILSGENPDLSLLDGGDVSRSLMYTPFSFPRGGNSQGYHIKVKSIKINSKKLSMRKTLLSVNQEVSLETEISTTVPYTTMESTLYSTFIEAYIKAATAMNISRVPPVSPFGVCFSAKGVEKTRVGPKVPIIDLVLQSKMVKWKIAGRNSMVHVSEEVMCLGFLDGGLGPVKASMVIGGHQLEDKYLEFNLGNSMLGFSSSSLLMEQRSCSDLRSSSISTL